MLIEPELTSLAESDKSAVPSASGPVPIRFDEQPFTAVIEQFADAWHQLLLEGDYNLSMAPEFIRASAGSVGRLEQMRVLRATRGGVLVGALPFFVEATRMYGMPMRKIGLGGNLIAYHHEITAPGLEAQMLRALLSDGRRPWDVFCAESLTRGGPTIEALRCVASDVGSVLVNYPADVSPYLPITQTWEQYLGNRSSNFRYNLKRKEKALRKAGRVEERWFEHAEDADEVLRCMRYIEAKSWKTELDIAVTSKPSEVRYYEELVPFLARRGLLFTNVIYLDGDPVAYHLSYRFAGRVGNLKTSFDNAHGAASPGAVVIQSAIRKSFESGAREFDFLGDDQYHKRLWTDHARGHDTCFLFSRRWRGRVVGFAKQLRQRWKPAEFHHVLTRADTRDSATD